MKKAALKIEILHYLNLLESSGQDKVLAFVKRLFKSPKKKKVNHSLISFAGSFNASDLEEMSSAISEGCETIDKNAW